MIRKNRALILAFALFAADASHAQTTSRLSGSVTDSSGAAIPGATVKVLLPGSTSPVATMETSQEGAFVFVGLNPGIFDLSIDST